MNCEACGKPSDLILCHACERPVNEFMQTEDVRQRRAVAFLERDNGFVAGFKMIGQNTYSAVVPILFGGRLIVGAVDDPYGYDSGWDYEGMAAALAAWEAWGGGGEPTGFTRRLPQNKSQTTDQHWGTLE